MNIAFIADYDKKELMTQFCTAYSGVLSEHKICGTSVTAKMIAEGTGLPITEFLAGDQGGLEQIAALVSCNQIDMLIYFRSGNTGAINEAAVNLMRLCDMHTVPVATNIAAAEMFIHGLSAGWLDWRDIVNPKK